MGTRKFTDHFGLEIDAFDIKDLRSDKDWSDFLELIYQNQLVVLRDQKLSPADIVALNKRLGKPGAQLPRQYCLPDYQEIFVISNIVENGRAIGSTSNGFGWHRT
jgi:alpha-ketoglutarate-dependent taurine dioxygenase